MTDPTEVGPPEPTEVGPPVWSTPSTGRTGGARRASANVDGSHDDPTVADPLPGYERPAGGTGRLARFTPTAVIRRTDWRSPFARLALAHATGVAGDALLAVALAGTLFFKTDPAQGRTKVLLGLLLTMAPFAVVGPFIGPLIDRVRGGHRAVIVTTMLLRTVVAGAMVLSIRGDSVALFPEAFVMLVAAKTYQVSKAAVVPTTVVGDEALVEANSKLQLLGGLVTPVAAAVGGIFLWVGGAASVAVLVTLAFASATVVAFRIPTGPIPLDSPSTEARGERELRSRAVVTTSVAMALIRTIVGFVTFLLAFALRGGDYRLPGEEVLARNVARELPFLFRGSIRPAVGPPPAWHFGVVLAMGVLGGLGGAALAPRLRRLVAEERILAGALASILGCALLAAVLGELAGAVVLSLVVAASSVAAKQAFDAVVQRDAPDADRGRAFARFEATFQLVWVLGALVPTAVPMSIPVGSVVVFVLGAVAVLTYLVNLRGRQPGFAPSSRSG